MKSSQYIRLFLFILTVSFLSCQKNNDKNETPVNIRWWYINSDLEYHESFTRIIDRYKYGHPGVDINLIMVETNGYEDQLDLQLVAQDPPEIFQSLGGADLIDQVKNGYLKDISPWINEGKWKSTINPAALSIYSYDGRIYGVPYDLGAVGFWYNEELLQKAGYETFPTDWEDFLLMLDNLKASGISPISLGIADRWPVMYYWVYLTLRIGGFDIFIDIMENRESFNHPAMIKAGEMMHLLYEKEYFQQTALGDDYVSQSRNMGNGTCALQLMGQWALFVQEQASDGDEELTHLMKFAPFPEVPGGVGSYKDAMGGSNGFVVRKDAPDEAVELLEYFFRNENLQVHFDLFPSVPTVPGVEIKNPALRQVRDYVQNVERFSLYPDQFFPQEIGGLLNDTSARIMFGEITPQEGCEILDAAWKKYQNL